MSLLGRGDAIKAALGLPESIVGALPIVGAANLALGIVPGECATLQTMLEKLEVTLGLQPTPPAGVAPAAPAAPAPAPAAPTAPAPKQPDRAAGKRKAAMSASSAMFSCMVGGMVRGYVAGLR